MSIKAPQTALFEYRDHFAAFLPKHGVPRAGANYITWINRAARRLGRSIGPTELSSESGVKRILDALHDIEKHTDNETFVRNSWNEKNLRSALRKYVEMVQAQRLSVATDWLVYWKEAQIESALVDRLLDQAASDQFNLVRPGDWIWICGRSKRSSLVTVGPLRVQDVVDQAEAERRLPYRPWKAKYHAMAEAGNAIPAREVSLASIINQLRFDSSGTSKLNVKEPIGRQLQRIRKLTPGSARLIRAWWERAAAKTSKEFADIQNKLKRIENLDKKATILVRREQRFLREYLFGTNENGTCAICGSRLPITLLVAAHIKRRADCTDRERRDYAHNVIPICLFGCDALFERGFLFVDDGRVHVLTHLDVGSKQKTWLNRIRGRSITGWKEGREKFFRWHSRRALRSTEAEFR
jgi:hypothetical protein